MIIFPIWLNISIQFNTFYQHACFKVGWGNITYIVLIQMCALVSEPFLLHNSQFSCLPCISVSLSQVFQCMLLQSTVFLNFLPSLCHLCVLVCSSEVLCSRAEDVSSLQLLCFVPLHVAAGPSHGCSLAGFQPLPVWTHTQRTKPLENNFCLQHWDNARRLFIHNALYVSVCIYLFIYCNASSVALKTVVWRHHFGLEWNNHFLVDPYKIWYRYLNFSCWATNRWDC